MNREQFLLERRDGLGGSDLAAICGISNFKSALDVYYEKINGSNNQDNQILQRGRRAEKYILEEYSEHTGETLETDLPMLKDKTYPFLIGHVDAKIQSQNVIIEAKSTRFNISSWQGQIPQHYLIQVAHYAAICDAERVDIPVLFNNWEYACFSYYRDEELEQRIRKAAIDFWYNHILPQVPPPPTSVKDAILTFPCNTQSKSMEANDNMIKDVEELVTISNRIKELERKEEGIKLNIMKYMQDAERLNTPIGCSILWKQCKQNRFDTNKFKVDHPEIYSEYLKTSEFRPLKIINREMI